MPTKDPKSLYEKNIDAANKRLAKVTERLNGKDGKDGLKARYDAAVEQAKTLQAEIAQNRRVLDAINNLSAEPLVPAGAAQGVDVDGIESEESVQAV